MSQKFAEILVSPSIPPGTVTGDSNATMVTHTALSRRRISCRATSGAPVGPTSLRDSSTTFDNQALESLNLRKDILQCLVLLTAVLLLSTVQRLLNTATALVIALQLELGPDTYTSLVCAALCCACKPTCWHTCRCVQ